MADEPTPNDERLPSDELLLDDSAAEAAFDDARPDEITAALAGLAFLDPAREADLADPPMPDWAWDRLVAALDTEAAQRPAPDNVLAFTPRPATETARPSRALRWAGGLVAASVAVVAVGVAVSTLDRTGGGGEVMVAGDAAVTMAQTADPAAKSAPESAAGDSAAAAQPFSSGGAELAAEAPAADAAQPAKMVMASNINYTEAGLTSQVTQLLDRVDVHSAQEAALMPAQPVQLPIDDGFTRSWDTLRECLTWLAKSANAQALVVDRARFEGAEAGVVVAPAGTVDPATSPPPTSTIDASTGDLDVWVVKPDCPTVEAVIAYQPYAWQR